MHPDGAPTGVDDGDDDGDDDGENDGDPVVPGPALARLATASAGAGAFERIPLPAGAHPLICDLTPLAGALYASTAVSPINLDGARLYRYRPARGGGERDSRSGAGTGSNAGAAAGFDLVFDWDRGGAPRRTHEVGGQGITRLRAIGGRLYATDSDAPLYGGFGLTGAPFEDYVFVSGADGGFPPLGHDDTPPAGTLVLPLAFHVFDVIEYRGAIVATGGTVALARGRGTRYPGGLFVGEPGASLLPPRFRLGEGAPVGVVRGTYMHRFGGRLYVGLQNNERRIRWDLAVLTGDPRDDATPPPVLARVTPDGGWLTRRFASGGGTLYWVAAGYRRDGRGAALFTSSDGRTFDRVPLPRRMGAPQDVAVVGEARYLLTSRGVYRFGNGPVTGAVAAAFALVAPAPRGSGSASPFDSRDSFCSAPLVAFDDTLYAGSRDGALYKLTLRR